MDSLQYTRIISFLAFVILIDGYIHFTNIKCVEYQPNFATFLQCRLKMIKRNTVALNLHVKVFQLPVDNVTINLSLHKKLNGYRPFMYNKSLDFCQFKKNPKQNPFAKIFFDFIEKDSNINHSCPYNHDVIIKNLILTEAMFQLLPLPQGEYMFQLKVAAYNDWKADVRAYMNFGLSFSD